MEPMPKSAALVSLGALLAVLLVGCSGNDAPGEAADGAAPAETGTPADAAGSSEEEAAPEAECNLPDDLRERFAVQNQLVLNVAQAGGENLEAVESLGALEPETFRSVAEVLDGVDLSGIPSNPAFYEPDEVIAGLHETADLLEAALAAGSDTADPAWPALTEFYTQEFFVRHTASVGYYLDEAGCV